MHLKSTFVLVIVLATETKCIPYNGLGSTLAGLSFTAATPSPYAKRADKPEQIARSMDEFLAFAYIPPPKTSETAALLNQSLTYEPNNTATIVSVMPYFSQGVISYTIQLNGFMAATLVVNASTSLPCDTIGLIPEPDLVITPQVQYGANASAVVLDCEIIAVNMYSPDVVNYWVQNNNGSICALAGSNKIEALDKIDTSASIAMVLRTATSQNWNGGASAREHGAQTLRSALQRSSILFKRAISIVNTHNTVMSLEACQAIQCIQNGGASAVYNPFTRVCGCKDPAEVDIDYIATT